MRSPRNTVLVLQIHSMSHDERFLPGLSVLHGRTLCLWLAVPLCTRPRQMAQPLNDEQQQPQGYATQGTASMQLHSRLEGQSAAETIPKLVCMVLTAALVGSGASHLQYHQGVQMLRGRMRILAAA